MKLMTDLQQLEGWSNLVELMNADPEAFRAKLEAEPDLAARESAKLKLLEAFERLRTLLRQIQPLHEAIQPDANFRVIFVERYPYAFMKGMKF